MFRSVLASVVVALTGASRKVEVGVQANFPFGASCDDLQTTFHNRVAAFQASLDAMPEDDDMSRWQQTRVTVRTMGIIRTLRRARTCTWVIQSDSGELDQARAIVQTLLAGNPCAEAARSELESGLSAETAEIEMAALRRAMSVLASDDCDATYLPEPQNTEHAEGIDANLIQGEDNLADAIEGMEGMEESGSSFIQTKSAGVFQGVMRAIGVAFLMILLLLACAGAAVLIGIVLAMALGPLVSLYTRRYCSMNGVGCNRADTDMLFGLLAMAGGFVFGFVGCANQMYSQLLPRISQ